MAVYAGTDGSIHAAMLKDVCEYAGRPALPRGQWLRLQQYPDFTNGYWQVSIKTAHTTEFEAASKRTLEERMRYAFIKTYKPVMDDAKSRSFDTVEEYRQWCEANLPKWLGYHRVKDPPTSDP